MRRTSLRVAWLLVVLLLAACQGGASTTARPDVPDVAPEVPDAAIDVADAGADAPDAAIDVADAGADAPDAGADARDAGADVHDAEGDARDAEGDARDAEGDAPDAEPDGPDARPEIDDAEAEAPDAGPEAEDAAVEAPDAGPEIDDAEPEAEVEVPDLCPDAPDTPNCAEIDPPTPDPLGWTDPPHATGTTAIAMTAEPAADPSGVEYFFECTAGPCHDSGWQPAATYEDTGLAPDNPCAYRVRARDQSANHNETAWSAEATATTDRDEGYAAGVAVRFFDFDQGLPALPELSGLAADLERLDAQIAYPPTAEPWTGLDAGFADTFASRHAGFLRIEASGDYTLVLASDEGARLWLNGEPLLDHAGSAGPTEVSAVRTLGIGYHPLRVDFYEDGGLAGLTLAYAGPGVESQIVPATALYHADPPDLAPPLPNPSSWASPPAATGPDSVTMTAAVASDPAGVQYFFECALGGCHDSGWQVGRTYDDGDLQAATRFVYRVRTRDLSLAANEAVPSAPVSVTTDTYVPDVVGLELEQAEAVLAEAALAPGDVTGEHSATVAPGVVLEQRPSAGALVPAGSAVSLVVSLGPEMVDVPDLVGQPQEAAEAALGGAGLVPGAVALAADCAVATGSVVSQQPAVGASVPKGSAVGLVVSRGPEQVVITELLYHPTVDEAHEEFLELYNPCAAQPVNLEGWTLVGPGTFVFGAGAAIDAGGYAVVAEDAVAFQAAHGFAPDFDCQGASLANGGELLQVLTASGAVADEVTYDDVPPWPVTPDGLGPSMEVVDPAEDNATPRNWHASIAPTGSTPRAVNSVDAEGLPPWISGVGHGMPEAELPITVTAAVQDATTITLTYVLDWGPPASLPLVDDGASGDGAAGDGVFGAVLPGQPAGTLVRYRLDALGPTGAMGFPRDDDTVPFTGTYLAPAVASDLEVFHWIIEPTAYAAALQHYTTDLTEPALLFHAGVLYDGLQIRVRGQSSRGWPKKHWNFSFAQGHGFGAPGFTEEPVDVVNLQSSYADKSYVREILSYEAFQAAGCPSNTIVPVAVYQNGQFFGLYNYLENKDSAYLARNGLDPEGGFYKAFGSQCADQPLEALPGPWEKQSPDDGDFTELFDLLTGVNQLFGQARHDFLFDTLDIPSFLSYQAVSVLIHNNDQVAKNYFLYRDSHGTQRWSMHAWDMDLTFGRSYQGTVLNDDLFATVDEVAGRPNVSPSHPLFGDSLHQKWDYLWNRLTDALLADPDIRRMYYRRLRTLMDELLVEGAFEARIDQLAPLLADEAEADRQAWGWYGAAETPPEAIARLKQEYLAPRRAHLFATHRIEGEIPEAQSPSPAVVLNELMYNPYDDPEDPADPGDDLEFVELYNPSSTEAVDLSGWRVTGVGLTLPSGAVILPEGYLLVVRNDVLFRQAYGPGHYVAAQYDGKLDGGGERVTLVNRAGGLVDEVLYDDVAPWPTGADGFGSSLELKDPALDNALPDSWAASMLVGGTPGAPNLQP